MTTTAPLFDVELRLPADDGTFILNRSELNGGDTLAAPVEVARNLFTNPSFEDPESIPSGAEQSGVWSISGTCSLYICPPALRPSTTLFPETDLYPSGG